MRALGVLASIALVMLAASRYAAPPAAATASAIAITARELTWTHPVMALPILPLERVEIEATAPDSTAHLTLACDRGDVRVLGPNRWTYEAPRERGLAKLRIAAPDATSTINVLVMTPFQELRDGHLGDFHVGDYPAEPLRGLAIYEPPRGFVQVTAENASTPISPHFVLGQFVCKQKGGYPKYIVLEERLTLALETILARVHELGHEAQTLTIMSGYRTPVYNAQLGDVFYSRHQWGDAADVYVDASPADGRMDDLDGDGAIGLGDAERLFEIINSLDVGGHGTPFVGGLGVYGKTPTHPEFVHVDMRGVRARWRG